MFQLLILPSLILHGFLKALALIDDFTSKSTAPLSHELLFKSFILLFISRSRFPHLDLVEILILHSQIHITLSTRRNRITQTLLSEILLSNGPVVGIGIQILDLLALLLHDLIFEVVILDGV